jgi:putative ABC transport system substrate-binding protein
MAARSARAAAGGAADHRVLDPSSADEYAPFLAAFRKGLNEVGFVEGSNVIEYRWANGRYDRLPAFATELIRIPVTVLVATGITAATGCAGQAPGRSMLA